MPATVAPRPRLLSLIPESVNWRKSPWGWTAFSSSISANRTSRRRSTSSAPRRRRWPTASLLTRRTPGCRRCANRWRDITRNCTASNSTRRTEITVTASGVQALSVGLRCMIDPGDEALVLTPSWPNGPSIIQMSHGVVKEIPQPLIGGSLRDRFRRAGTSGDAAHAAAAVHIAVESAGLGGDREGSGHGCSTSRAGTACG